MKPRQRESLSYRVQPGDTAQSLAECLDDNFPPVLATARMVALMELAAARLMTSWLKPGELSVGVNVNVTHLAATAVGDDVTVCAEYLEPEGKLYRFKLTLEDSGGVAGEGFHTRAIIEEARLLAGAKRRAEQRELK